MKRLFPLIILFAVSGCTNNVGETRNEGDICPSPVVSQSSNVSITEIAGGRLDGTGAMWTCQNGRIHWESKKSIPEVGEK